MTRERPQHGPAIRAARKSRGWSQAELGRRMGGVLPHRISEWEHDRPRASVQTLFALGRAMEYAVVIGDAPLVARLVPSGRVVAQNGWVWFIENEAVVLPPPEEE